MAFSTIGPREVCIALTAICAVMLALRPRPRTARAVWLGLLLAGIVNALVLNLQSYNFMNSNLIHYYLGAKYAFPYRNFYELVAAAQEKPQIGMRDLWRPDRWVRGDSNEQRAYYIDLMRGEGLAFDPVAPLAELGERAQEAGVIRREARLILSENLPAARIEDFRSDVIVAASLLRGRELTKDAGYNGSPFCALVRRADPTLYMPIGPATAWLNLAVQSAAVLILAWVLGAALGLELEGRLGMAALVFASWDFVAYAFPGLVFAGLFIPMAIALHAMRRRRAPLAGAAIAWAGLVKLFPFVLLLPSLARLLRAGLRRARDETAGESARYWLGILGSCAATAAVLAFAATLSGRSWTDFFGKILAQFAPGGTAGNNVSLASGLRALGVTESTLPSVLSAASLGALAALFLRGKDADVVESIPRRLLIVFSAVGWVVHKWLNYYSIAALLLLPLLARRHRAAAPTMAIAMALSFALPDFDDPRLVDHPALLPLKLLPYILIPAWLVLLEFRAMHPSRRSRGIALAVCALCLLATAGEVWRMRAIERLGGAAYASLHRGDTKKANDLYRRLLRLSPRNSRALNGRAVSYAVLGDRANAERDFERAIRHDPQAADLRLNYGIFLRRIGRIEDAARELEAARRIAPYNESVLLNLARVRIDQARTEEAISLLARARELRPENRDIEELLGTLQ